MKRPAFQFYPADWRKDAALQSCSMAAQGFWVNCMCIAHECEPYGHMTINDKPMNPAQIGRLVGLSTKDCAALMEELQEAGVSSVADGGAIFSRRMVRDEELRIRRANGGQAGAEHGSKGANHGSKGGRPKAGTGDIEGEVRGDIKPPLKPPPSSSSSSSTSVNTLPPTGGCPFDTDDGAGSEIPEKPGFPDCPFGELRGLWKNHLPHLMQPRVWEGARKAAMRNRWRQAATRSEFSPDGYATEAGGVAWWDGFFGYIARETTLSNGYETNGRSWRPSLEWVCNSANFQKIIDGNYAK